MQKPTEIDYDKNQELPLPEDSKIVIDSLRFQHLALSNEIEQLVQRKQELWNEIWEEVRKAYPGLMDKYKVTVNHVKNCIIILDKMSEKEFDQTPVLKRMAESNKKVRGEKDE